MSARILPFPSQPASRVPERVRAELARVVAALEEHAPAVAAALRDLDAVTGQVDEALQGVEEHDYLDATRVVGLDRAGELLGRIEWALPDRRWLGA